MIMTNKIFLVACLFIVACACANRTIENQPGPNRKNEKFAAGSNIYKSQGIPTTTPNEKRFSTSVSDPGIRENEGGKEVQLVVENSSTDDQKLRLYLLYRSKPEVRLEMPESANQEIYEYIKFRLSDCRKSNALLRNPNDPTFSGYDSFREVIKETNALNSRLIEITINEGMKPRKLLANEAESLWAWGAMAAAQKCTIPSSP